MSWWTINSLEILVFFFRPMIWCKLLFKILIFKQSSRNYTLMLMHPIDFQMQDPWAVVEWTGFLKIHFDGTDYANDSQVDSGYILKKKSTINPQFVSLSSGHLHDPVDIHPRIFDPCRRWATLSNIPIQTFFFLAFFFLQLEIIRGGFKTCSWRIRISLIDHTF